MEGIHVEQGRLFFCLELVCEVEETKLPRTGLRHEDARGMDKTMHLLRILIEKLQGLKDVR